MLLKRGSGSADGTYQHARLYGDIFDLEHAHHAANAISPKNTEHVVVQTEEKARAAWVSLSAR